MSASWHLQQAVHAALTAANVAGGRIYDHAPAGVTFPFVQIGESQALPDDTSDAEGGSDEGLAETFTLHVWSRLPGLKESKEIIGAIRAVLHGKALAVLGRASALSWVRSERAFLDPDGKTRHGVVTVEVIHRN